MLSIRPNLPIDLASASATSIQIGALVDLEINYLIASYLYAFSWMCYGIFIRLLNMTVEKYKKVK
jgi:hypothetical protein